MAVHKVSNVSQLLAGVSAEASRQRTEITKEEALRLTILGVLEALGGLTVGDDSIKFEGEQIILPAQYEGNVAAAENYLRRYREDQENTFSFTKSFNYRPWDVANAFQNAMKNNFGTVGLGKETVTFFGTNPPQYKTIDIGVGQTAQVPWGEVEFPPLKAVFTLFGENSRELGSLGALRAIAPKKYRKHIEAFFKLVEEELKNKSIYKGRAITGGGEPTFLDVNKVDERKVIYSEEVMTQLNANLWSLLEHTDVMRDLKLPLKRAVLLEGPYGTGKTLAGMLTAQKAVAHGWTYILCRTGQDDLKDVLRTAQIYAPAVVWFEDIDTVATGGSVDDISSLLDTLDGITSKGAEVVAAFTTNFVEKIQKGVMRPGRLDAVIHIGHLDQSGFQRLIENLVPAKILGEIDYEHVANAFAGFLPAFAAEAINRAMRYSISRNGGRPDVITTDDLVDAALGLRPQLKLMEEAKEGADEFTIDDLIGDLIEYKLNHTEIKYNGETGDSSLVVNEDLIPIDLNA